MNSNNLNTTYRSNEISHLNTKYLKHLFSLSNRIFLFLLCCIWLATFIFFWNWWFQPDHIQNIAAFTLITGMQVWLTALPLYFLYVLSRSKTIDSRTLLPDYGRVAIVVTKAPSEPFALVKDTLIAALKQKPKHDTWLADESPTKEVVDWCSENNVYLSSRFGVKEYHRSNWPRRTRCKEGNLTYFYDKYGYDNYDFVVQMDADHIPSNTYLLEILKPFSNPKVGYVSAPSICNKNAKNSWSARGRLFGEALLHGAIQAGHNGGLAPLCIGSHYAVRTIALKQIGGLGPELAEDHSTTLTFNAYGWSGVHAIDAIAYGDGPETFYDLIVQEFQWSRSLMSILITILPRMWNRLPFKLRAQFLFSELWYPLFSIFMLLSVLVPIIAIAFQITYAEVTYAEYIGHFVPMTVALLIIISFIRQKDVLRPNDTPLFSWELPVFIFARWPWSLLGSAIAINDYISKTFIDFKVTSKRQQSVPAISLKVFLPYFLISIISSCAVLYFNSAGKASGFYYFAIVNSFIYLGICLLIAGMHKKENHLNYTSCSERMIFWALILVSTILAGLGLVKNGQAAFDAITFGVPFLR